mmetsp:Transcript_72768/g.173399  ORF Transcript_72768/g.173399 Transcript_72768/m.173399 type:complete len:92 (-) Transcript_72768:23-298(-)
MQVVLHRGQYIALSNRRLAVFRLLEIYSDENLTVPAEVISKPRGFKASYTTPCNGDYACIRYTDFFIGRTYDETNFDPFRDRLSKPSSSIF